jgi:hypothetical protein
MRFGGGEERVARVSYVPLASPPLLPSGRALRRNAAELLAEKRIFQLSRKRIHLFLQTAVDLRQHKKTSFLVLNSALLDWLSLALHLCG